jgi:hypothetical protein
VQFKSVTDRMRIPEIKELLLPLGAEIEELPGQIESSIRRTPTIR